MIEMGAQLQLQQTHQVKISRNSEIAALNKYSPSYLQDQAYQQH